MRLTIIHPAIGHRPGHDYIRSWQMEPLPAAAVAGLTPRNVEVRFYDDRMERIPFDEPTDLVAMSVETYTAKRAYQIASKYRRRGIPVVMGGFHATLCPDEVAMHSESVVIGEAEGLWPHVIDDYQHGTPEKIYRLAQRPNLAAITPDRSIFRGKRYLPVHLVEAGRGCHFRCDFCAVQSYFGATQNRRPTADILSELAELKKKHNFFFFVDDNITSNMKHAKDFFRALAPLKLRWVSQASINAAHDTEFLELIRASGCQGLLIGFESLDKRNLSDMNKSFNMMQGGYEDALRNLRRFRIRLYSTFVFGYDHDTPASFEQALDFARSSAFYMVAFNHLTPFPGTPLYERLQGEHRLLFDKWWLDDAYDYNRVPFRPLGMSAEEIQAACISARRRYYSVGSILRRSIDSVNRSDMFMWRNYFLINYILRRDISQRDRFPLGDPLWNEPLLLAS